MADSTMVLQPEANVASPATNLRLPLIVAIISCASLLLELALTRLFSVVLFYHFAFLAISVALLGLGAGGVFAHIFRSRLADYTLETLGSILLSANALVIVGVLETVLHSAVSLNLELRNFEKLSVLYFAAAIPFFVTGLLFSIIFARESAQVSKLYGFDLLGGALACLLLVPLLNVLGAPNAVLCSAVLMGVAAALFSTARPGRRAAIAICSVLLVLIALNYSGRLIDIIYAKGMRRDASWIEFARWNALSRVEVDKVGLAKYIVIDADASTAIMNVDPGKWDRDLPSGADPSTWQTASPFNWKHDLMNAAPSLANVLRPRGDFAIIGPGGGVDVLRAVANGSQNVTGVEINPLIANTIMRQRYADYAYHLYDRPEVHLHVADGRSYLRSSRDQYDVVQMTLVDTWASTAAGAYALSENNLYTVEAFREYFDHLRPDGIIAITRWEFRQPREALRVVSQAMEALHELGVHDPREHFMVVSDGPLDQDGRPVIVLARKSAFTSDELGAVRNHLTSHPKLVSLYLPNGDNPNNSFTRLIKSNDPRAFAATYQYNVSPVFDASPFFFFTLKTGSALADLRGTRGGMDWRVNLGILILGMVLLISIAAVLLFLLVPLLLEPRSSQPRLLPLSYFVAIGLGYILIEITLIQRFVLFLGHPTYALTVVIFLMLLSSGAGSLSSRVWRTRMQSLWPMLAIIVVAVVAYLGLLPLVLRNFVGLPFEVKLFISGLLLVPLGFLMGMPFPSGLHLLSDDVSGKGLTEWAWAMNASASVLGSVLAMVIAIHFGLNVTLFCGGVAYGFAGLLASSLKSRSSRTKSC
jgi:SAM-dependent methyltransferase